MLEKFEESENLEEFDANFLQTCHLPNYNDSIEMLLELKEGILKARAALGGTVEVIGDEKHNDKMLQESETQPKSSIFAP